MICSIQFDCKTVQRKGLEIETMNMNILNGNMICLINLNIVALLADDEEK